MKKITSIEEFKNLVASVEKQEAYRKPIAFAAGRADLSQLNPNKALQMHFPVVNWNENFGSAAIIIASLQEHGEIIDFTKSEQTFSLTTKVLESCLNAFEPYIEEAKGDKHLNIRALNSIKNNIEYTSTAETSFKVVFLFEDKPLESIEATYLKLYALSLAKVELRGIDLNGAFGALQNVAWSQGIPYDLDYLRENEIELKMSGEYPHIDYVDKFPRFLQHVIPADNTRILDTSKVRFGAQLAAGTTVMPGASYINFNAGTLGPVMVEGRISSSAIVGAGSDIGGGASILGVLSGTDGNPITIGENCLLDVNSVTGISIANGCRVSCKIDPGSKFIIPESEVKKLKEVNPQIDIKAGLVKAKDIQGLNGAWFRMNSESGHFEIVRSTREVKLNADLH